MECPICNGPIPKSPPSHPLRFCSTKCAGVAKRRPIEEKRCEVCGKAWMPRNRTQVIRNRVCSPGCSAVLVSRSKTGRYRTPPAKCLKCKAEFRPKSGSTTDAAYCSTKCAALARNDDPATLERLARIASLGHRGWTAEGRKAWFERMTGEANPAWKGGVTFKRNKGNYVGPKYVRCPPAYLAMARADGYVMEHRLIMARMAGRCLTRVEVVHHVDHATRNNSPGNLELWPDNRSHKLAEAGRLAIGAANRLSPRD